MTSWLSEHWRAAAITVLLVIGFGYAGVRIRRAFRHEPLPDWLQMTEHRSLGISRAALRQFERVMQLVEQESRENRRGLGALQFLELASDPTESVLWRTESVSNCGFSPLERIECDAGSAGPSLLGYYTIGGEPIRYTTRFQPQYPQMTPATLYLPQALAPSTSQLLIRRERFTVELHAPTNRGFEFTLPPRGWSRSPTAFHVSAVWLGDDATLVSHAPERKCTVLNTSDGPLLVWLDTQAGIPIKVAFARR